MKWGVFLSTLLASMLLNAAVPIDGWYANLFGGYTYLPNNLSVSTSGYLLSNSSFHSGYNLGGRFGYKSNPFRYEGEFTYIHANVASFKINQVTQNNEGGDASVPMIMANIYYDFPELIQSIEPFLGFGIGYTWVDTEFTSAPPSPSIIYDNSNSAFTYQGTAGLTYNYAEHFSLDIAYRYLGTGKINYLGKIFQANLVTIGATYRFDGSRYT